MLPETWWAGESNPNQSKYLFPWGLSHYCVWFGVPDCTGITGAYYLQVPDCPQVQGAKGLWLADKSGLSNANKGFPGGADRKESACNAEDLDSIPGLGRTTEEGNGYSLQYSCWENSMDRGASWAILHGVTKSQTTEWLTLHFNGNKHVNLGKGKSMWFSWA